MSIQIKPARTSDELDQVLRVRHTVFAEEENYLPAKDDKRIYDRYDILPTNANIIAVDQGEVVGSCRFTQYSSAGFPADKQFDYSPHLPYLDERIITGSMLCVKKSHRGNKNIIKGLLWMGFYWGMHRGATHVLAPINPIVGAIFLRMGFKKIHDVVEDEKSGLPTLPMCLTLSEATDGFVKFVEKGQYIPYVENFTRGIYKEGEPIINLGDIGDAAYVVVDGKVRITCPDGETGEEVLIRELGPGEIFGEIALLTEMKRTANVTAVNDTDVMILSREDFQKGILDDPKRSLDLLKLQASRMADYHTA